MRRLTLQEGYNQLERTSTLHTSTVCVLFFASIRIHNDHTSTIGPFDYQVLHHAFSEEVVILSRMEREQFAKPICHVVWSEWLDQLHGVIHARRYACTEPHLAIVQGNPMVLGWSSRSFSFNQFITLIETGHPQSIVGDLKPFQ